MKDMVGSCCVCSDDRGWPENPLVYCDGQSCTVAVHQACYGIVTVPTGPWYCRKCESQERSVKVKCELCPSKYGALKRTDNSGWAHVVCALYIPEVRFGNVTTMEPIQLQLIPQERFNKVCYICEQNGKPSNAGFGACMQCNKSGCKQQFHVTCAQSLGLLCEEAGNYLDNVKYCGYCQHHYSKLKKGGNVKTIPPYKPISSENPASDSSSEKETSDNKSTLGKRKSSVGSKSSLNKVPSTTKVTSSSSSSSSYSKSSSTNTSSSTTSSSGGGSSSSSTKVDKVKTSSSSSKSSTKEESGSHESSHSHSHTHTHTHTESKSESKKEDKERSEKDADKEKEKGKKRKANSRTPTPSIVVENELSSTKKEAPQQDSGSQEPKKKLKTSASTAEQPPPPPPALPPVSLSTAPVQLTTASATSAQSVTAIPAPQPLPTPPPPSIPHSIIQPTPPTLNSVVVSVPLHNTTLSPRQNPSPRPIVSSVIEEKKSSTSPSLFVPDVEASSSSKMLTSELTGGGLKITFEKQTINTLPIEDLSESEPIKRSRSQSSEKGEKSKSKKRGSNGLMQGINITIKKSSKSQSTPPPQPVQQSSTTTFVNLAQNREHSIKDSPPSSPSSESLGAAPTTTVKKRGRKSNAQLAAQAAAAAAQAAAAQHQSQSSSSSNKDSKESLKLFQNGINAPHMLGNQLNLNSNMAQKMTDHLNSELEAHSIFNSSDNSNLVGPPLQHRVIASARSSSVGGSSTASGGSGLSSMLGGSGTIPQTLDQLLERQWEQGSQFLMEQAQHFDIASLLSCLHQLRAENLRLEEHVNSLLQRRDHLLAVNARLAIPLTPPATPQSNHPHTVNNIHPAVSHAEASRPRHSSGYPPHVQGVPQHPPSMENGIAPDAYPHSHRSPAGTQPPQPSPRQSSSGYASSGFNRQNVEAATSRGHRYNTNQYYNPPAMQLSNTQQQQMVIRTDMPHMPHSKPPNS